MEKNTTLALQFAIQFFEKQLPVDILRNATKKAKCDIDTVFPLNQVNPDRKNDRAELWRKLDYLRPKEISQLKTALIIFSAFHVPFSALMKNASPYYDENPFNEEIVKLRELLQHVHFCFEQTRKLLEKEIRWREVTLKINRIKPKYDIDYSIDGVIKLYRDFLKSTKAIDLNKTRPEIIASFLSHLQNELRLNIKKGRNPSLDLPLRVLIFVVFMILWSANKNMKASARLTAALMNEYFFHNAFLDSKEMTADNILKQWKDSKYNGEVLHSKPLHHLLK